MLAPALRNTALTINLQSGERNRLPVSSAVSYSPKRWPPLRWRTSHAVFVAEGVARQLSVLVQMPSHCTIYQLRARSGLRMDKRQLRTRICILDSAIAATAPCLCGVIVSKVFTEQPSAPSGGRNRASWPTKA